MPLWAPPTPWFTCLVARRLFFLSHSCRADSPLTFRLLLNFCSRRKLEEGIARAVLPDLIALADSATTLSESRSKLSCAFREQRPSLTSATACFVMVHIHIVLSTHCISACNSIIAGLEVKLHIATSPHAPNTAEQRRILDKSDAANLFKHVSKLPLFR